MFYTKISIPFWKVLYVYLYPIPLPSLDELYFDVFQPQKYLDLENMEIDVCIEYILIYIPDFPFIQSYSLTV